MHSGQVNAAPLLASFLGSENEKIGQNIAQGDFSGELQKLMRATAKGAGPSARNAPAKPEKVDSADPGLKASAVETPAAAETKSSTSPSTRGRRGAADSRTKINGIKAKAQKEQSLVVSNPGIAQTVLADLRYPAQTRKACEGMQNKEGQISIKDLRSLLNTQGATGFQIQGEVPAEHARALVESIIAKGSGTNRKESASGGTLQSSVQIKTEGSYTPGEFRGLLNKVLQQADTTRGQLADPGPQRGSAKTAEGLKRGQTESLVETVLPSFISADRENDSTRKIFAGNSNDRTSEAQNAKVRDVRENSLETVSDNLKSEEQLSAAKAASGGEDNEGAALVTEAGIKGGGTGSPTFPASALPSARQETVSIPVEALDPVLKYFDAKIVAAGPQQPEANTAPTPSPGGPYEASAAQAQNLASQVKGAEKQADGPRGTLSSWRLTQHTAEQAEAARIKTAAAESPSSDRSFDGNPNRAAVPSPEIQAKAEASATKIDSEQIPADPSVSGEGSEQIQKQPGITDFASESAVFQSSASSFQGSGINLSRMESSARNGLAHVDPSRAAVPSPEIQAEAEASVAKIDSEQLPADPSVSGGGSEQIQKQPGSTDFASESAVFQSSASSFQGSGINLSRMESSARNGLAHLDPSRAAVPSPEIQAKAEASVAKIDSEQIPADPSVSGGGSDSGPAVDESASAARATEGPKVAENHTALPGPDTATLSKQIEKQPGSTDFASESAVFQSSASSFQGSGINLSRMESSARNGLAYLDPSRAAVPSPGIQAKAEASVAKIDSEQIPADPSVSGKGPDSGPAVDESSSAARATDGPKVTDSHTALPGPDTAILSKQIEKQLGSTDFASESAVFQSSASSFQGSGINLSRMENSAQNGLAYLDPYRPAELAQNAGEQLTGGVARHIVLEMEPDELGKISIKVGAKKGEISVEALTQSEPARQALMRHSPGLRQDLQDQGLVLEKFMVDVNRDKSGGGNYPGENNPKGKTPPVSKTAKTVSIQATAESAYIRDTDGQSRISIFA